jgi:DNA-binding MarR family transcriptional regulator
MMLSNNFKKKLAVSGDKMMPATQCLFLYLLYNGDKRPVIKTQAAEELGLTKTSITRASEQLKAMGLISEKRIGKETEMIAVASGLELYERAKAHLIKPVQRSFFISVAAPVHGFIAGESALSDKSMLGKPKTDVLAIYKGSEDAQLLQEVDPRWNEGTVVMIELWKYDPGLFAKDGTVDPVSLAMSLSDNEDERVQGELQEYLEGYKW